MKNDTTFNTLEEFLVHVSEATDNDIEKDYLRDNLLSYMFLPSVEFSEDFRITIDLDQDSLEKLIVSFFESKGYKLSTSEYKVQDLDFIGETGKVHVSLTKVYCFPEYFITVYSA